MAVQERELQKITTTSLNIIVDVNLQQVSAIMQKITQFQAVVQKTLKKDHDYGVIPGTDKPTLLKPGAEKILMLMGLTSEYDIVEKVQDYESGFFAFTVKCTLYKGDMKITEGLGHANTKEARYAHRWVTEKKLPDGVNKNSLPKREKEGKYGKYVEYQIDNDDPYTLANTVLKMAKKRAQVDAVLTVASLSEIFTQDLEDELEDIPPAKEAKSAPQRKDAQKTEQNGQSINWSAFWGRTKGPVEKGGLGLSEQRIYEFASKLYEQEVQSLKDVVKTQQDLDDLLVYIQAQLEVERINQEKQGA